MFSELCDCKIFECYEMLMGVKVGYKLIDYERERIILMNYFFV